MIARAARAASASGTKLDPKTVRADVTRTRTVVLAYPLSCLDRGPDSAVAAEPSRTAGPPRTAAPVAIDIIGAQGASVRRDGDYVRDTALGVLLPGVQAPASSLAAPFVLSTLRPGDTVRITYADAACTGGSADVLLPVKFSAARAIDAPLPALPEGAPPTDVPVRLQALIDLDGILQRATYIGGPGSLSRAAIEAAGRWRSEPARANGAAVTTGVVVTVRFK